MGNVGITKEQVLSEIDKIIANGDMPTTKKIRENLKTGSLTTISKHLNCWKKKNKNLSNNNHQQRLDAFDKIKAEVIADILESEHPQTIAFIVSHLSPEISADVLELISDELRNDILQRLSSILYINPKFLGIINNELKDQLSKITNNENNMKGGVEYLSKVVSNLKGKSKNKFINRIKKEKPDLAKELVSIKGAI